MNMPESNNYKEFYNHVFGDYRYYYYNGLSEEICTRLEGIERTKAENLVLQSLKKIILDERAIRAAGYLKLQTAIPLLEKRIITINIFIRQSIRSAIIWALLKIKGNKELSDKLINVVKTGSGINGLTRPDAVNLLSDFGMDASVVTTLLDAFVDEDIFISASAENALHKVFRDNLNIFNLIKSVGFLSPKYVKNSVITRVKMYL